MKIDKLLAASHLCDAEEKLTFLTANAERRVQMSSKLQDSVEQLQNCLQEIQVFKDNLCSGPSTQTLAEAHQVQSSLILNFASLHYKTKEVFIVLMRSVDDSILKKQV